MVPDNTAQDKRACSCEHRTTLFWCGAGKNVPVLHFRPDVCLYKNSDCSCSKMVTSGAGLTYKFVKTECRLLRQLLEGHGFREIHQNSNDFNIMWCGCHVKPYTLRGLTELQKVNHFPRSYEITRKDRLYKNYMRMRQSMGAKHFNFLPVTFVLPSEVNDFYSTFQRERGFWIAKPVASSRGRGISIISHPNQISLDEQIVVCKYISNPLLVDGFKFDLRIYVMVTSFDPLRVYVFNEGLARFSTVRYDGSPLNLSNIYMHLTNYSINKKSSGYVKCSDPDIEDYGNKWSMSALLRYLKNEGYDTASMMMRVEDLIIKTLLSAEIPIANACRMFLPHRENCFELFGFDVIFDEDQKPWLLEVNLSPSLACESPLDLKIKSNLLSQMLTLAGVVALDPYSKRDYGGGSRKKSGNGYSMSVDGTNAAPLSNEDLRLVRQTKEEYVRKGAFFRIFPTEDTWDTYSQFLENKTHYNFMLHSQLYPNKSKEKGRPSSAVVTMNKFREMNQPTNMNLSVVPGSIQEKYSRYEKSLQPLGAVEDYPPEALADAITPDFSVIDDSITDTTRDDDSSSSSVYSCEVDGDKRTIATQTHLLSTESKDDHPDSGLPSADSPDIPTDDRPLADILYAIKRGCLRPLAFPECYHPCYTPPPGTPSYDRHTSVFKPIYSAFNPQTQAFELPLTRKERVSHYSHYVDLMNKYSTRMNLVDLRCTKSVLKLLPSRPKSGDKRPSTGQPPALQPTPPDAEKKAVASDEKRGSDVDMQRKRKDDVREVDLKERERPGSLTLRSYIPDTAAGARGKPGDKQPGQDGSRGTVPRKPEPPRGVRKEHMIAKSYAANLPRGAGISRVPRYRTISQTLAAGVHRPIPRPPKTDQHKPAAGVEVIKQCALDFGYKKIGPGEVMTYDQFLEEQRKAGKITSRSSSAQTLRSEFNDDIVVPVKTVKNTGKKKNSVVDKDQSQSAKKKKNAHGSKAKSNFSSLTSSRTSFSKSTSNSTVSLITSSKSIKSLQEKGGGVPEKQQLSEKKGAEKEVEKKKVPEKPPQNAVKKVTSQTSIIKDAKPVKTDQKLKPPVQSSIKKVTSQTSITNEKRKLRPNSAGSCMSTDSSPGKDQKKIESQENAVGSSKKNKGGEKTGVNVSVFTRDNITVSPKEVVVSRTVNKDMTTILVTVPHGSENLFTKTKIGKVEISLDSPTPEIVRFVSTDLQSASTKSSRKSTERTESSPKVGRRWSCASTMSEQSSSRSRSPAVTRRGHQAGGGAAGKSGGGRRNVEVVDAGYISCTSPLLTPPSPVSLLKKGGAPERKPEGKSDITRDKKSNKTSPYGPPNLVVQDKKPAVRSSSRPSAKVELVSEPSPYGASNLRYKVVEKESCDQVDGKSRGHGDAARSRSRVLSARDAARDASKVKVTRCVSNKVRGKSKKGDDQGTRSLPIICKRQKSGFESDLAQNRHRLLLGGGV